MNNQKRLEELLEGIIVESTIQYLEAKEVSGGPDEQSQETHIEGVMVNEALVPELKLSVRSSKTFTCIQPAYRDHCIFWPIPITDSGLIRSPILELCDH